MTLTVAQSQNFVRNFHNFISQNLGAIRAKNREIWAHIAQIVLRTKFGHISNEILGLGKSVAPSSSCLQAHEGPLSTV